MRKFFIDIYKACKKHDLPNLSANISFFAILSLLPLTMIFVSVLGYVLGSGEAVTQMADKFTGFIPGAAEILQSNVQNLIKGKSSIGIWGISFLILVSIALFTNLEKAFNKIFGDVKRRNVVYTSLLSIVVIFIILLFLFLPSAIGLLEGTLTRYGFSVPLGSYLSGKPFFISFAMLSFIVTIIVITNKRVYIKYALVGGALYAIGITVAKYLFRWYLLVSFDRYNLIYGSLTALMLIVIWIYYLSTILLLSAEVVAYLQGKGKK